MSEPVIVDRVTKRFSGHTAVDGLSLSVAPGIIYGLLGPNGAGKTTTLRMIMDIYEPDSGSIRLFDQVGGGRTHSARIGYLPEERGLYPRMRVLDVLVFLAEAKGVSRRAARVKALEWLERLGLADWRLRKVSDLSKGMQQKVQFISTVLHDPDLVIFDEPFSGLDPVNSQVLRDTVVDYRRRGKTVLFSTHIMEHAEKLCDRLCIIARRKKLVDGTLAEVKQTHGGKNVIVAFDDGQGNAQQIFSDRRLVAKIQDFGQEAELELAPGADAQEILKALVNSGARLARFELASPSFRATLVPARAGVVDSLKDEVESKRLNGFLIVTNDLIETGRAEYQASNLGMQTIENLQRTLGRLVVKERLEQKGVNPGLVDWAQIRIALDQKKISHGRTTSESAAQSFLTAYLMAILLFMAILLYGVNVMSSVLEEKTTRVIEVLVSSVRPFQLMLGKILGAGSVSFFQFVIWGVSARVLLLLRGPIARALGADPAAVQLTLPHIPAATLAVFIAFFLGGFLLYSAMFAAVGAMSSNEQEARQAQQPVTYVLMISYLSILALTNDPSSTFAKTLSLVPFTTPIATPVRWTAGSMPMWELATSLGILALAIVGVTWVAARIYRVGILMTGKRPNVKELMRWVRTA